MIKCIYSAFLSVIVIISGFSQSGFEAGINLGLANYSGDLSPSNVGPILAQSHFAAGVDLRYNMNRRFSFRTGLTYAGISGSDALSGNDAMKIRNLSFYSDIYELAFSLEVNIFPYSSIYGDNVFTPYAVLGFGAFKFDPVAEYEGQTVRLQPLGTEGQGTSAFPDKSPYSLVQMNVPFGGGVKMKLAENITGKIELNWRWTFTDYLDDLSTVYGGDELLLAEKGELAAALSNRSGTPKSSGAIRGGPTVNDYYFTGTLGIAYAFDSSFGNFSVGRRGPRRAKGPMKCPKF